MLSDKLLDVRQVIDELHPFKLTSLIVYLSLLVFMLTPNTFTGGDSPGTVYLPVSLIRHGTLRLDPYINRDPLFDLTREPHWVVSSGEHYYSKFSPVTSLVVAPVYGVYFALTGFPQEIAGASNPEYFLAARLSTMLLAVGVEIAVFSLLRRFVRPSIALFLTLAYAFSTYTWNWATSTLTTQSTAELFLALGLLAITRLVVEPKSEEYGGVWRWPLFFAGLWFSLAFSARLQIAPVTFILSMYVLWRTKERPASWISYMAGALPVWMLLFLYNSWAFGSLFYTGYGTEAVAGWRMPILRGLAGILISPSHGLMVYSPVLAVGFVGGMVAWFDRFGDAVESVVHVFLRFVSLAAWAQLLLMSRWWAWHGGVAYNQRMVQEIHPLLMLLTGAVLVRIVGRRRWFVAALVVVVFWGYLMNAASKAFYGQHLVWLEQPHPEIAWSWAHIEVLMYLRWHGVRSFLLGLVRVVTTTLFALLPGLIGFWFLWLRPRPAEALEPTYET